MQIPIHNLTTEASNDELALLDSMSVLERLAAMNKEDHRVADAVQAVLPQIAEAVALIVHSFRSGGRLYYIGAGTSGRLGVLDASECPPTFGTDPNQVQGIIAGGATALVSAVEGAEDDFDAGAAEVDQHSMGQKDTLIGISASGRTPYVIGALRTAAARGVSTIALVNNSPSEMQEAAEITIAPIVGPESLSGSTRMKAGTAQKMVLNLLTTNAMIEIGKTYGNLMVDVRATNVKLRARAIHMVQNVTEAELTQVEKALDQAGGSVKLAIVLLETGLSAEAGQRLLDQNSGFLRTALAAFADGHRD